MRSRLRSKVATAVAAALPLTVSEKDELRWKSITGYNEAQTAARRVATRNGSVQTGIDVLEAHNFDPLRAATGKKKIGLLTNQTGVDLQGRRTIDVLAQAPGISLDAIFSPEHGVTGDSGHHRHVANSKDAATGVPVYSVYGANDAARRPSQDVLKNLDAVVFDIQDVGVRFYTYETTLGYFLEAAAKAGIEIIVLDRPNPITGSFVQGADSRCRARKLRELFPRARPSWHDHGRTGEDVQRRAQHQCPADGRPHGRMDARRLVRLHRPALDQSFAQHAQPHGSDALPGRGTGGRHQRFSGPGHGHSL